ncbi:divergent PAP2 family protein [Marinicrinis lubricantis]
MFSGALRSAMIGIATAQALKIPFEKLTTGRWNPMTAMSSGGMPSSHSAAVSSLATYTGLKRGFRSIDFALAAVFGLIVMYDAMGVRRHAGEIAVEVNKLDAEVERLTAEHYPGEYHDEKDKELKEMLGHLPGEVAAGAVLGAAIGGLYYLIDRS